MTTENNTPVAQVAAPVVSSSIVAEIDGNVDTGTLFLGKAKNVQEAHTAMLKPGAKIVIESESGQKWTPTYKGSMGQNAKLHVFFQKGGLNGGLPPTGKLLITVE